MPNPHQQRRGVGEKKMDGSADRLHPCMLNDFVQFLLGDRRQRQIVHVAAAQTLLQYLASLISRAHC
eukprot:3867616-Rhodomonas_salina.1